MNARSYIDAFDYERAVHLCMNCGLCLQKCPVMKMTKEESRLEMGRLLNQEEPARVLNECTFCFNCNHYCPNGLRPYALIMQRLADQRKTKGKEVPDYIKYLFTGHSDSSVFSDVYETESNEEKEILRHWEMVPPESNEVLFVGCTGRMIPYGIEHSSVLQALPKFGPRVACCGELSYRLGDYDTFIETVDRTKKLLERVKTDCLVCYCGSCANFLGNIWPNYHGVTLPFKITSIWEWLWERVKRRELAVKRPLTGEFAITDSCYSSELGDHFLEAVRGLHEVVGIKIVELANNRYENLTCGAISIVRNDFDLTQGVAETKKKIAQVKATGVADLSCYCPGCYVQLRGPAKRSGLRIHYALEEILWALGDDYPVPLAARAERQSEFFLGKVKSYMSNSQNSRNA